MNVQKNAVNQSPFVGIFCKATSRFALAPQTIFPNEKKYLETVLQVPIMTISLANSPLIGVLCIANQNGVVVNQITEKNEILALEKQGVAVLQVGETDALGNLLVVNDHTGFASPIIPEKTISKIEKFLKIKINPQKIAGSDLTGSNLLLNNRGFACNPVTSAAEFSAIQKHAELKGNKTSANLGDLHVANSAVANDNGALLGPHSTAHEMFAVDEALSGHA